MKQQVHIFRDESGNDHEWTMEDVIESGTPVDDETGEDMEYIGPKTENSNMKITKKFIAKSKSRYADSGEHQINWKVTLSNGSDEITIDYSQGIGVQKDFYKQLHNLNYKNRSILSDRFIRWAIEVGGYIETSTSTSEHDFEGRKPRFMFEPPSDDDILYCLTMESDILNYDKDEWIECFTPLNAKHSVAEKLYQDCLQQALWLNRNCDLNELRDKYEDY